MICNHCQEDKDLSHFYLHSNGKPRKQCKQCHYNRGKGWVSGNRDKINQYARENRDTERAREANQRWRKQNLAYDAYRTRTYRARKLQAVPQWADIEKIKIIYEECPDGHHVDHIVPLKGKTVCGLHVEHNLQYLPAIENIRKRNFYA